MGEKGSAHGFETSGPGAGSAAGDSASWHPRRLAALRRRWSEPEIVGLVALVGFYRMVSGLLNTLGVQPEEGLPGWPA